MLALKECVSLFLKKDQPESFDLSIHKEKFDQVHEALQNPLTLHDVNDDVQLIMSTDASQLGIGGVLYQENPKDPDEFLSLTCGVTCSLHKKVTRLPLTKSYLLFSSGCKDVPLLLVAETYSLE